jgi:autotransporter-associated beta strand protein
MKTTNIIKKALSFIAAAFLTTAANNAQAVVFLWNNTGTQWTSPTSWTNGVAPAATSSSTTTDEVQFGNVGANFNAVDMTSTRALKTFTFLTGANAYTFGTTSAKIIEINGGLTNNSVATQTFNLVVNNANNSNTWTQATGGALVFNNTVNLTTGTSAINRTLTLAGDGAFTFNGAFNQGGTATAGKAAYTGNGTVTFNGTNALGGSFDISGGGTVTVNGGTGLGSGAITLASASGTTGAPKLVINSTNGLSVANTLKGASSTANMGTLDLIGSNADATTTFVMNQYLGNSMNFTNHGVGKTLLQFTNAANILTVSTGSSGGKRLINNSANLTLQFDGTMDIGSTTAENSVFGGTGDFIFKGSLLNTAAALRGFSKTGTGTLTLQAVNAYNGDTTIAGGTLLVDTAGSIASSAAVVSGGTLQVKGLAGLATVNSGSLTVDAGGTVGATTLVGGMMINSGSAGVTTVATGSTLDVRAGGTTSRATVNGGSLLIYGSVNQTTVNSGIATVYAGGNAGGSTVNGSMLTVNGLAGDVVVNTGGTLGGSGSVQGLTLNGGTVAPGNSPGLLSAYELNGSNGTFAFQLSAPTTRGITYDAIDVSTLLTLGSNTAFTFETLNSYTYVMGDTYDLFNFDSINAEAFDSAVLLAALPDLDTSNSNLQWNVTNFTTDGIVNVIPEPSTASLLLGGTAGLIAVRLLRRNKCKNYKHV